MSENRNVSMPTQTNNLETQTVKSIKPVERALSKSSVRSLWYWPQPNKNKVSKKNITPKTSKKSLKKSKTSNHSFKKKKKGKKSSCSKCLRPSRYELQDTYSQTDYNPYFESMYQPDKICDTEFEPSYEHHKHPNYPPNHPDPNLTVREPQQQFAPAPDLQPSACEPKPCQYDACSCHNVHKSQQRHEPLAPAVPISHRPAVKQIATYDESQFRPRYPNYRYPKREYEQERSGLEPPIYPEPPGPYDQMYRYPPVDQYRRVYRKPEPDLPRRMHNYPRDECRIYDPNIAPDMQYHHVTPMKEDTRMYRQRNPQPEYRSNVFQTNKCPYKEAEPRAYCSYLSPKDSRTSLVDAKYLYQKEDHRKPDFETTVSHSEISLDSNMYIFEYPRSKTDTRMETYPYPNCRYSDEPNYPQYSQMEDQPIAYEQKPDPIHQSSSVYNDPNMMYQYPPKTKTVNFRDTEKYPYAREQDSRMLFADNNVKMPTTAYYGDKPINQKPNKRNDVGTNHQSKGCLGATGFKKRHRRHYKKSRVIICDACTITKKQLEVNL